MTTNEGKDKDAGALRAARRTRGPAAQRHFNAEHRAQVDELVAMRKKTPEELAELVALPAAKAVGPADPLQFGQMHKSMYRAMVRPLAAVVEAYRSEANGLKAERADMLRKMAAVLAEKPSPARGAVAYENWANRVQETFDKLKEKE